MTFLLVLPAILSFLVLAAHWLRGDCPLLAVASVAMCGLLILGRRWVARMAQIVLVLATLVWVLTTYDLAQERMIQHREWLRAAVILLSVGALSLLAAGLFQTPRLLARYRRGTSSEAQENVDAEESPQH